MSEQEIAEGRRLLAAVTPGPYRLIEDYRSLGYSIDPLPPGICFGMEHIQDARAVLWLLQHAEALLDAADAANTPEEWRR